MSDSTSTSYKGPIIDQRRRDVMYTFSFRISDAMMNGNVFLDSPEFCSQDDPRPITFRLSVGLNRDPDLMSVYVTPVNRPVTFASMQVICIDPSGGIVDKEFEEHMHYDCWAGEFFGWPTLHAFSSDSLDDSVWRIVFDAEYSSVLVPFNRGLSPLQSDLLELLASSDEADVEFVVQGESIKAHKSILIARWGYFRTMFQSSLSESVSGRIDVTDVRPQVFKELLRFIYSGQVNTLKSDTEKERRVIFCRRMVICFSCMPLSKKQFDE